MHKPFPGPGTDLGAIELAVSAEANDRYWRGAAIDHPLRVEGWLYPPMAVNFTILLVQRTVPEGVLHTWGRLRSHAAAPAPETVRVTGAVTDRFEKRGRDYFVVASEVRDAGGGRLWSAELELASPARRPGRSKGSDRRRRSPQSPPPSLPEVAGSVETRRLTFTADLLRTYSRAGNFHSDDATAREMGLPGMVAMGMQTTGPAYGVLLDAWGRELLETGELEVKFFGAVAEGETVEVGVACDGREACFEVRNVDRDASAGTGRARLP